MLNYYHEKYNFQPDNFPISRDCYLKTIALPLHNRMKSEDYQYIVETIKELKAQRRKLKGESSKEKD